MNKAYYYPEDFGDSNLGDGIKDATEAIRDACSQIQADGVGGTLALSGQYRITGQIDLPSVDGLSVVGGGSGKGLIVDPSFSGKYAMISFPSDGTGVHGIKDSTATTSAHPRSSTRLFITDPSLFKEGDIIRVLTPITASASTTAWLYQHNEIESVNPAALDLIVPLAFPVPAGAKVDLLSMRRGLTVTNLSVFSEKVACPHTGIFLGFEKEATISNVCVEGTEQATGALGGGLILHTGYKNKVDNVTTKRCGGGGVNAVGFRYQTSLVAQNIRSVRGTFGIGVTRCTDSQFVNLTSERDSGRAIKLAAAYWCQFSNVMINQSRHTGLAVSAASKWNTFQSVQIRGVSMAEGSNTGLWLNGEVNNNNSFFGVLIDACPIAAVAIQDTDYGNLVQLIKAANSGPVISGANSRVVVL